MDTNYLENNYLTLVGKVTSEKKFSHEIYGERFYSFDLSTPRLSGNADIIPVTVSERLINDDMMTIGTKLLIKGQFRSYNSYENEKNRLILTVFAKDIEKLEDAVEEAEGEESNEFAKKDTITNKRVLVIVRNIGKASDFDSQYKTMKYISYTFTFVIAFIGFLLIGIVSSQLTIPMKKIKDTADKIGTDGDLAKRIEYTTPFKELDAMIQANNRMMDRLEDLFQQQQQFTSDVAHELRTPSAIVSAECQYLKKYGKNIDDYTESLTVIERQNTKTTEIISQLLQLSRLEQGRIKDDFEYSNFKTLIESVCDMEPLQFKKQITIYSNLDDISIYMNVGLMAIAVKNIINNAMKYSKNKSSIKLKLWKEKDYVFLK